MPDAKVLPFPSSRRVTHINRVATNAARYKPESADRYLASILEAHAKRLVGYGIDDGLVARDTASLKRELYSRVNSFGRAA